MSGAVKREVSAVRFSGISTPDRVESRLGTLEFTDGAPSESTAQLLYDNLDFVHGVEAFINAFPGASLEAMRQGFLSIGVEDNSVLLFSELMDSASLFLTANCDTVYFLSFVDLTDGPMVLDVPPLGPPSGILGTIDDTWFRWVTDFGLPGPDRAQGGRYLIVGPGYDGKLPDSGYHVSRARTTRVIVLGRAFMVDNDPAPTVAAIRDGLRISKYVPGGQGTAVATFLAGEAPLAVVPPVPVTQFVEGSGVSFNTIPPNDFTYWDMINNLVQQEPAGAGEPETLGLLAAVGIVKDQPFNPDARMRKILEEAVVVGNATARTVSISPRPEEGFAYYPDSQWFNMLFIGGYRFLDPPPEVTADGVVPGPTDGARKLNARTAFFYPYTGITPAMCMRLTGIGSQYIMTMRDGAGEYFDGGRSYRLTLPPDIPENRFWSVMVYDRQTRSMLQTDQAKPAVGSQSGTVETNPDGSTDVYIGPTPPDGKTGNWLQTVPGKGFFAILRLYSPLQPFFDKTWRPSEIEPM
ncbi:DUF1254 domain-containing protein [Amycolatopsis carbonis]|uniref:DUF1254 domain-containing protein n=1 Tax=Amycolatopsis carbonis TaxID=715471 RepID=A0A9Y2IE52_9PSEU|nr:DUF1254 domain-containing protein [Amycolatopsis sp. 2-15]WIX76848.1 DUF1254 domain-containing protein [Amycolatopsis sp. 2-15]